MIEMKITKKMTLTATAKYAVFVTILTILLVSCGQEDAPSDNSPAIDCGTIWQASDSGFYDDNPTHIDTIDDTADWDFSTPEAQGMNSTILDSGLDDVKSNHNLFSITIIRNNHIVRERFYNGSAVNHSNNIHSASKSMLLSLIALAVEQGHITSLDDYVKDYFPSYSFPGDKANIRIRHLMNMSSGWEWDEDYTEYKIENQSDWVKAIIALGTSDEPGTVFNYSTGNTHILSALIANATGKSICEYAHGNLFEPLKIYPEHWGRDPNGVYSGGFNMYMTPREMAKYALFILDIIKNGGPGVFNDIVKHSVQVKWQMHYNKYTYGELWWQRNLDGHLAIYGEGYGGQFMYIMPDLNIVLIITQDTARSDDDLNSGAFIENYIIPSINQP